MTTKNIRAEYTESLEHLPDVEMLTMMERYRLLPSEKIIGRWLSILMGIQILSSFAIVPVFITFASLLTGGNNYYSIALGLSGYAFTQLLFQPLMTAISRKVGYHIIIILGGLLLFAGSTFLAYAMSKANLQMIILARMVQGVGAIMTPILSLAIESCRPQARGSMLVVIATGIGLSFAASMPIGATLDRLSYIFMPAQVTASATSIHVPYLLAFGLGILGLVSSIVIAIKVPRPAANRKHSAYYLNIQEYLFSLKDPRMIAIYTGAFVLPTMIMMLFYHIPFALRDIGNIAHSKMWIIYLFTFAIGLLSVFPFIIVSTSPRLVRSTLIASVSLLLLGLLLLVFMPFGLLGMVSGMTFLFVSFNLSEMTLVRIVPRLVEPESQPASLLTFLFIQLCGTIAGSWIGATIMYAKGWGWLYLCSVILCGAWLSLILLIGYHKTDYTLPLELQKE